MEKRWNLSPPVQGTGWKTDTSYQEPECDKSYKQMDSQTPISLKHVSIYNYTWWHSDVSGA